MDIKSLLDSFNNSDKYDTDNQNLIGKFISSIMPDKVGPNKQGNILTSPVANSNAQLPFSPSPSKAIDFSKGLLPDYSGPSSKDVSDFSKLFNLPGNPKPEMSVGNLTDIKMDEKKGGESKPTSKAASLKKDIEIADTSTSTPESYKPTETKLEDPEMRKAMETYNRDKLLNLAARQAEGAFHAKSGGKLDEDEYKIRDELAKQDVDKLNAERAGIKTKLGLEKEASDVDMMKQGNDANSPYSKAYREAAKGMLKVAGLDTSMVGDNLPASKVRDLLGPFKDIVDTKMKDTTNRMRMDELSEARSERQDRMDLLRQDKLDAKDTQRFDNVNKMINADIASSRSAFGKNANIVRGANAIETLAKQIPDPNNMNTRQITELAKSLDAMLSQGAATISGTNKLIPKSAMGDVSKIAEYIGNIPVGAQQGEFVKQALETVQREKELANKQIKGNIKKLLGSSMDLKDKHPEKFNDMLRMNDLDPEDIFGEDKPQKSNISNEDQEAIDWAKKNSKDPRAQRILKLHGM